MAVTTRVFVAVAGPVSVAVRVGGSVPSTGAAVIVGAPATSAVGVTAATGVPVPRIQAVAIKQITRIPIVNRQLLIPAIIDVR